MKKFFGAICIIMLSVVLLVSCPPDTKPGEPIGDQSLVTADGVIADAVSIDENNNVTVNLGNKTGNLYLVISNLNNEDSFSSPSVSAPTLRGLETPSAIKSFDVVLESDDIDGISNGVITDYVEKVIEKPLPLIEGNASVKAPSGVTQWSSPYTNLDEGDPYTFVANKNRSGTVDVTATLRKKVKKGDKTLFIFVENSQWENNAGIDQDFVDAQAEAFLPSSGKGVWELDEDVFGSVYGEMPGWTDAMTTVFGYDKVAKNGSRIDNTNEVLILFLDINETKSTKSGTGGYFSSLHTNVNVQGGKATQIYGSPKSNEAVMLFMDAYLSKNDPAGSQTTMAHEFQHAIHNYQRQLKKGWAVVSGRFTQLGCYESTFVTELFATLAEEMVANKLGVSGPGNNDETTGGLPTDQQKLINGRIAQYLMAERYNLIDYKGVQSAPSNSSSVFPYGLNFSFGAYLIRNYGHDFIKNYLALDEKETDENTEDNFEAITSMLAKSISSTTTWEELMRGWGASLLLSDVPETRKPYKMLTKKSDSDFWFTDAFYAGNKIASANHYGYKANVDILGSTRGSGTTVITTGPLVYNSSADRAYSLIEGKKLHPNTNTFVLLKAGASGTYSGLQILNSNENLRYTFVLK